MKLETQKYIEHSQKQQLSNIFGYSLIEVLVAMAVFSIAIAIATSYFISALGNQNRALEVRESIDNVSNFMEYISRALRMAKKDLNGQCISSGNNYENPGGDKSKVRFLSYDSGTDTYRCREFYLSGDDRLKERKSNDETANFTTDLYLTSDDLLVTKLRFELLGEEQSNDNDQPRVTLLVDIAKKDESGLPTSPKIKVQTTLSQRNLDILQ